MITASFRRATKDDRHLDTFDYTKLTAINMCPTWGLVRYAKHKTMHYGGRAMALEAGKLMHECFSVIRLYQLSVIQGYLGHADYTGENLFGRDRWEAISCAWGHGSDDRTRQRNAAWECLSTGNYVDDPDDKKRTYTNMETCLAYYVDRWDNKRYPVWVRNPDDMTSDVGIEIAFDIVCTLSRYNRPDRSFRLTGRIDGLHVERNGELLIQENKTAWQLNNAWRQGFQMSHQVTGYCVAASVFADRPVEHGLVIGLTLPLPKEISSGLAYEPVVRPKHMQDAWLQWVSHTLDVYDQHIGDVYNAPKMTHSCQRFNRPCSMIPFCASDREDQQMIYEAMHTEEWSPLHDASTGD